ncbi:MAG: Mu-like prophage major head subunit gpT family protein [Candidatus Competibacteraceae bacterium]
MSFQSISSRAIIGRFYRALEQDQGEGWVNSLAMMFTSDQQSETYRWLGQVPTMREWIGGRLAKPLRDDGVTIPNKPWEATLEIPVDWMKRDKTGQIQVRINELAQSAQGHWAELLTVLIANGASTACYDGQYFFADAHSEGSSGSQDNNIGGAAATNTQPTAAEMQSAIVAATAQILGFKDDQGRPMNAGARRFTVMVPVVYLEPAVMALGATVIASTDSTVKALGNLGGFGYDLAINPRLTWTDKFALFRSDGSVKPFIKQEEDGIKIEAVAEGSELEFNERMHRYGVSASRNVGYGYWQHACLYTFT